MGTAHYEPGVVIGLNETDTDDLIVEDSEMSDSSESRRTVHSGRCNDGGPLSGAFCFFIVVLGLLARAWVVVYGAVSQEHRAYSEAIAKLKTTIAELKIQLRKNTVNCNVLRLRNKRYSLKNQFLKSRIKQLSNCHGDGANDLFTPDQIKKLETNQRRGARWSNEAISKGLQLKFACGGNGYTAVLDQGIPLPSNRTLMRRLQSLKFMPGILHEVFNILKQKIASFSTLNKNCTLCIDEMSIEPGHQYDTSNDTRIGSSFDNAGHKATHGLVFLLCGLASRWKQPVAYFFTGSSMNGDAFKALVIETVQCIESIGLKLHSITTDMGPTNLKMWKSFGIEARKESEVQCSIVHPTCPQRRLWFFPDVVHVFKNIVSGFSSHGTINLSPSTVSDYDLPSNLVYMSHIWDLFEQEKRNSLRLNYKLQEYSFNPSSFQKMRVSTSTNLINTNCSNSLFLASSQSNDQTIVSTAWFVDTLSKWFAITKSRISGLGHLNMELYNDTTTFLRECIQIFRGLNIGDKIVFKPVQKGLILATSSLLEITEYLLSEEQFQYVLPGRFTNDAVENLFSLIRLKTPKPNSLQFKNTLKLLSIQMYVKKIVGSSYEQDDNNYFSSFLDYLPKASTTPTIVSQIEIPEELPHNILSYTESNALYYLAGYLVASINNTATVCADCIAFLGSRQSSDSTHATFTRLKQDDYNNTECLFFINDSTFEFFESMEARFNFVFGHTQFKTSTHLKLLLTKQMLRIPQNFPICHTIKDKLIARFIKIRLLIENTKKNHDTRRPMNYSSFTMSHDI